MRCALRSHRKILLVGAAAAGLSLPRLDWRLVASGLHLVLQVERLVAVHQLVPGAMAESGPRLGRPQLTQLGRSPAHFAWWRVEL